MAKIESALSARNGERASDDDSIHDDLVDLVESAAAEQREDVILQALHIACGAAAIGLEQVRPRRP